MVKILLSVIGVAGCLALAINVCIQLICAALHHGKIELDFNHYHEMWPELIMCLIVVGLGVYSLIYLVRR